MPPTTINSPLVGARDDEKEVFTRRLSNLSLNSTVFCEGIHDEATIVDMQDVEFGGVLGSGGFSNIREFRRLRKTRSSSIETECSAASSQLSVCSGNSAKSYAVKQLREDLNKSSAECGAIDLAIEAKFLSILSHRNIVSLHCVSESSPGDKDFFIVIERIDRTVGEEIRAWRGTEQRIKESKESTKKDTQRNLQAVFCERVVVAIEITHALQYLHEHHIIHRDIKPENIGLDFSDEVKIFDFGCAKELKEEQKIDHNQYLSTAMTGTRRYMAPEVYLGKPYGPPADIFSFCILLWQILSLKTPFDDYRTFDKHATAVYTKHQRPPLTRRWPKELKKLLEKGWHKDACQRRDISSICSILQKILAQENVHC